MSFSRKLLNKRLWFLTVLSVLFTLSAFSRDFSYTYEGKTLYYTVIDEIARTCKVKDNTVNIRGILEIPSVAKDYDKTEYSVVEIGDAALSGNYLMTEVSIPNSVTKISEYAFRGCLALTKINIPDSVTTIGVGAFSSCEKLTSLSIGNKVEAIGAGAFSDCTGLTKMILPNSITSINASTFANCTGLTEISIPNSVNKIEKSAFNNCSSLKEVNIPNSVTKIDTSTFYNCSSLKEINIPNSVTTIAPKAFEKCSSLTKLAIPNFVKTIGYNAFAECSGLDSVSIGYSVDTIGMSAFYNCRNLTKANFTSLEHLLSIHFRTAESNPLFNVLFYATHLYINGEEVIDLVIPESIQGIKDFAFAGCNSMNSVKLHASVKTIGKEAFAHCKGLTKAEFASLESICSMEFSTNTANPLFCAKNLYIDGKEITELKIPESIRSIGEYAFIECRNLKKVEFASIEALCSMQFGNEYSNPLLYANNLYINNKEVTDLVIPESVKTINDFVFIGCTSFTKAKIPNSVTTIGSYAFTGCNNLTSVNIPNSVVTLGSYAFASNYNLKSVVIGNSLAKIEPYTFSNCKKLTSLTIGNNVEIIGQQAFEYCDSLKEVTIPNSVREIGHRAFHQTLTYGCLKALTLGNSVETIEKEAFWGPSIKYLKFLDGTKEIPGGCKDEIHSISYHVEDLYIGRPYEEGLIYAPYLEKLTIGNTITEVRPGEWKEYIHLKNLTLGNSIRSIGDRAFLQCELDLLILPPSVIDIGDAAFEQSCGIDFSRPTIIGPNVQSIGELSFTNNNSNVYITAQTPPKTLSHSFTDYSGSLYVQGKNALNAYSHDPNNCWNQFKKYIEMVEPTGMEFDIEKRTAGKKGETIQLTATIVPDNVTLPQVFWRSTNPEIATVDNNGLVTLQVNLDEISTSTEGDDTGTSCKIIAESLFANGPTVEMDIKDVVSGVEDVLFEVSVSTKIDPSSPYEVYSINGVFLGGSMDNLVPGMYIIRQGANAEKHVIR